MCTVTCRYCSSSRNPSVAVNLSRGRRSFQPWPARLVKDQTKSANMLGVALLVRDLHLYRTSKNSQCRASALLAKTSLLHSDSQLSSTEVESRVTFCDECRSKYMVCQSKDAADVLPAAAASFC